MRFVADIHRSHPVEMAATFRSEYGISALDIGTKVSWGEAYDLTEAALQNTATALAAAYNGWAYPASMSGLLSTASQMADAKAFEKVSPWGMKKRAQALDAAKATPDEIQAAQRQLDEEIVFN
jgi:enamine deaminase RidA (YjgF/YER057c/UK114 family)